MKVCNALCRDDTEHGVYYYLASEADSIIERLTAERDAAVECAAQEARYNNSLRDELAKNVVLTANNKELIDNGDRLLAVADSLRDEKTRLTDERDALKEGLDGWHKRYLDCEVERDALEVECEKIKMDWSQDAARLIAERNEYQIAADKQAMAHKVERDALGMKIDALALDAARMQGDMLLPANAKVSGGGLPPPA
jgi:hypothetical protein